MSALRWSSSTDLLGESIAPVALGDIIRTGENFHPHYQIVALAADRAWIRDTQHGTDHVVPLDRCRPI